MTAPEQPDGPRVDAPVLVTGGTGNLGRRVVARLRAAGQEVRVLSRGRHGDDPDVTYVQGDLATGDGVAEAVAGCAVVVHCAGSKRGDGDKARTLVAAATASPLRPHLVNISVVGADRVPVANAVERATYGYFAQQLAAEQAIATSGLSWTTLRATQFHDLLLTISEAMTKLPIVPVPAIRFQPIDAGEVADRLTRLALGTPSGLVPELGGPEVHLLADLLRSYWAATGKRRVVLPVRQPGRAARAFREGANLATSRDGTRTWEQFLADHLASPPGRPFDAVRR